jgi:hypothetical protein
VDTLSDIIYRGFKLNDANLQVDAARGIGKGITGSVVDSWDFSEVDIVQYLEKRSLQDGSDAGDVFQGVRRLRMAGTLYSKSRALLYDSFWSLMATLSPVLAQRESPADKGYLPLYFSTPTARTGSTDYPGAVIALRVLALPRAKQLVWQRDNQGGQAGDSLAIPWQATFLMKDPLIYAQDPQDISLSGGGTVAGNFNNRGNYLSYLNVLAVVGAAAGSLAITAGGATLLITIPASTGNRNVIYDGKEKVLTIVEGGIETVRYDLLSLGTAQTHPQIPAGASSYTFTFTGVSVQGGSHAWYWETYAA